MDHVDLGVAIGGTLVLVLVATVIGILWWCTRPVQQNPHERWHVYYRVAYRPGIPPRVQYRAGGGLGLVPPEPQGWERVSNCGYPSSLLAELAAEEQQTFHQEAVDNACRGEENRQYVPTGWTLP